MKTFKRILLIALGVLPVIVTAIAVFFFLPDTVAVHFGFNGTPDRYGSKYEAFLLPGITLVTMLTYVIVVTVMSKKSDGSDKDRAERNIGIMDTIIICIHVMLNALCIFLLLLMADPFLMKDVNHILYPIEGTILGIVFIILGNILPKTKKNSFIGMRMKFTMDTDEHWYLANRAGGIAMVAAGLVTVAAGLILRSAIFLCVMVAALVVFLTIASVYSYVIIKKEKKA